MSLDSVKKAVLARLTESSSQASIAAGLLAAAVVIENPWVQSVALAAAAACAIAGVLIPEKKQ